MKRIVAVTLLVLTSSLAWCMDRDVKAVVNAIEHRYGVRHHGMPWLAKLVVKPAMWGKGMKMDFAIFDGLPPLTAQSDDLDALTLNALGSGWNRFIRSESRKTGERAVIYVREKEKKIEMMIVSVDPKDESVVMKMRVDPEDMQKWMDDPGEMAGAQRADRGSNR